MQAVLPSVQVPTLLLGRSMYPEDVAQAEHVAALMPDATVAASVAGDYVPDHMEAILDTVREFLGVSRPSPELDTVLSTVLFTDIVASTERQAGIGDRAWRYPRRHGTM